MINLEIARFLLFILPEARKLVTFDLDRQRALLFKEKCQTMFEGIEVDLAPNIRTALNSSRIISMATTALEPHVFDLSGVLMGSTILHISLRDLSPDIILSCENIVDDVEHVCQAQTSVHLAEQRVGHRDFIRSTLPEVLIGSAPTSVDNGIVTVFSPFGLGVLDIALGELVFDLAMAENKGLVIDSFYQR